MKATILVFSIFLFPFWESCSIKFNTDNRHVLNMQSVQLVEYDENEVFKPVHVSLEKDIRIFEAPVNTIQSLFRKNEYTLVQTYSPFCQPQISVLEKNLGSISNMNQVFPLIVSYSYDLDDINQDAKGLNYEYPVIVLSQLDYGEKVKDKVTGFTRAMNPEIPDSLTFNTPHSFLFNRNGEMVYFAAGQAIDTMKIKKIIR